jgi:predicted nucleotidyltransferase
MIQNSNIHKVLEIFLEDSLKGFGLREISRKINLGLPSVSKYVKELIDQKILIKREIHGIKLIFGNRESELFKKYKIAHSIIKIERSGLNDFLDNEASYPTVILFGSISLGEDRKESDIDLCVITPEKKELILNKFEKKLKKEIQVFKFSEKEFSMLKRTNKELFNNIINGISLRGMIRG